MKNFKHLGNGNFVDPLDITGIGVAVTGTEYDPESDEESFKTCIEIHLISGQTIYLEEGLDSKEAVGYTTSIVEMLNQTH